MPATSAHIDSVLFSDLTSGNELALERLFRERYAGLATEGKALLDGDGASAARAIERVFVEVWKERKEIPNPAALEAFLHDALHEAAARIKSRHAVAHHLGGQEGTHAQHAPRPVPSTDEAWKRVSGALHVDTAHAAEVAHEAAAHSRHEAASHVARLAKTRSAWPMIAIGLVGLAAVVAFMTWAGGERDASVLSARLASSDARSMSAAPAQQSNITLAERSTVRLGSASKIVIPRGFGASVRGVKLEGTATFAVSPDQERRFTVVAGNVSVVAAGTAFTVRAYPDERDVTVRVREGKVTVTAGSAERELAAGEALIVSKDGAMHEPSAAELEQALGWTDGVVVAIDRPLGEVLTIAKQWFALEMFVADQALLARKATMRAPVDSPRVAIASIEKSAGLEQVWEGQNMVLRAKRR